VFDRSIGDGRLRTVVHVNDITKNISVHSTDSVDFSWGSAWG
jgi:hypothetical protein